MKSKNPILTADLKYSLSDDFPADGLIIQLKAKIEKAQKDINESKEVITYLDKLRIKKLALSN